MSAQVTGQRRMLASVRTRHITRMGLEPKTPRSLEGAGTQGRVVRMPLIHQGRKPGRSPRGGSELQGEGRVDSQE